MPSYEAQRDLAYGREQLFDLAADVECYPEFLPGWIAARIHAREGDIYYTEQVVGFGTFREQFRSKTVLRRPEWITVTSVDGVLQDFNIGWFFDPLPNQGCRVRVQVDFELRSRLARFLLARTISHPVASIMSAFESRAHRIYGTPGGGGPTAGAGVAEGAAGRSRF